MAQENISVQLNDLLASRDFQAELLDKEGRPTDAENADIFTFDYVSSGGKNYGTMVIILDTDNEMQVFYGDNLGRSMEGDDKTEFFDFVQHLHKFANMRRWTYSPKNINQVKYTMQGLAAIKEGLFEGYYGTRKVSYSGEPTEARLVIQHNRTLGETDARFRYVESLFIETADSERYRLQFKNLAGGRAMLEHVRQGGKPYDVRGSHITEMVAEIATLSRFNRASAGRVLEGITAELVTEAQQYYKSLRENLKRMAGTRGYQAYFESWHPAEATLQEELVDSIKTMFVEQTLDSRIEAALPVLARLQQENRMKEADIFESWADNLSEGTWALPDTPEKYNRLQDLMSRPLIVGPDATNATEQLDDLVGDDRLFDYLESLADRDASANVWDDTDVQARLGDLGIQLPGLPPEDDEDEVAADADAGVDQQPPVQESRVKELSMDLEDPLMSDEEFETKYGDSRENMQGRAGRVQDRRTGRFYDPDQEFDNLKNSPEFGTQMRRMAQREGVAEGLMNKIANKVMGAAPEQPKYKVGQRVKYETSPHQPDWKDGGRGVGVITAYKNGHYMINNNPVNHFEIKGVVEQGVAEGQEQKKPLKTHKSGCGYNYGHDCDCGGTLTHASNCHYNYGHDCDCGLDKLKHQQQNKQQGVTEGDVFRRHGKNRNPTIAELEMWIKNWTSFQIGGNLTDAGRAKVGQSIAKAQRLLAKKKQQQGVAEAFPNPGSGSTGSSKEDQRIAAALRKKHIPSDKKQQGVAEGRATYGPITDAHKAAAKKAFAAGERDGKAGAEKNKQYMSSALMKTTYLNGYKQGKQGVAEGSLEQRIAQAKKNNPLRASVAKKTNGYAALVTDTTTGKPSWFGGALWQTPELAMGHAKAFVKGFPYLEQEYAQRFIDKNRNGIVGQGVAEGLNDTQKKIEDTINKLEDRLKHAKSDEQWDRIKDRIERLQAGLKRSKQGVAEVSKATIDRYVAKASDAHGDADFAARMSKNDPDKRSYHVDQKKTAEKRRQGISRALDRMSREESVSEAGNQPVDHEWYRKQQERKAKAAKRQDQQQTQSDVVESLLSEYETGLDGDQVLEDNLPEAKMSPQQQNDFDRMRYGAMSRKEYDAKWKKPQKSDDQVIYGKKPEVTEAGTCNHTMEGEMCPEHGLTECGMHESQVQESQQHLADLARLKSLAHGK